MKRAGKKIERKEEREMEVIQRNERWSY